MSDKGARATGVTPWSASIHGGCKAKRGCALGGCASSLVVAHKCVGALSWRVACWSGGATQAQRGCSYLQASKELQEGATHHLVGTYERGRILQGLAGTRFKGLHYKLEDKLGLYQAPYVFTCCKFCLEISNTCLSLNLVFPEGVLSRVMLTKNMCVNFSCMLFLNQQ